MNKKQKIISNFLLAGIIFSHTMIAMANSNLGMVVKNPDPYTGNQSWFILQKEAGGKIEDAAILKNNTNQSYKAHLYAVDATSNGSGQFVLNMENDEKKYVSKWMTLKTSEVIVGPNQNIEIPFSIEIPKQMPPGQYFGGLVLEESQVNQNTPEKDPKNKSTNVIIKTRLGLRIYLTIPGEIKDKLIWQNMTSQTIDNNPTLKFYLKNTGNVALEPKAKITVFNAGNKKIQTFEKMLGEIFPGTITEPTFTWVDHPLLGKYRLEANIAYTIKNYDPKTTLHSITTSVETKSANFTFTPWKIIFLVILFTGCLIGISMILIKYYKTKKHEWESYEVKESENIISLATKYGISWQKLARVNKMKAPFLMHPGDKILVPKKES